MSENKTTGAEQSILENPYEKEIQEDIWRHERKKAMYSLFIIGALLLVGFIGSSTTGIIIDTYRWLQIGLIPFIFFILGVFAFFQPMVSAIVGVIVIIGITIINYLELGSASLIFGWLIKSIALYFIITSFRHAREAEAARKNLQSL